MTASEPAAPTPQGSRSPAKYVLRLLSKAVTHDGFLSRAARWRAARTLERLSESARVDVFRALADQGARRPVLADLGATDRELVLAGVDRERCRLCRYFESGLQVAPAFGTVMQHLSPDEIASAENEDIVEEHRPDGGVQGRLNHQPSGKTREALEHRPHKWADYGTCGLEGDVGVHGDAPCTAFGDGGRFA